MNNQIQSAFVDTDGASAYTGIPVSTLEKKRLFGGGPAYRKIGRSVRYSVEDLHEWMERHAVVSTSQKVAA